MYTTKSKILQDVRQYAADLLETDRQMLAEIRQRETEIQRSQMSERSRIYGMQSLQKLAHKQEQLATAHETQLHIADISEKLLKYADRIEEINRRYSQSMEMFNEQFDLRKVVEIERREMERVRSFASEVEKVLEEIPSFDSLKLELVTT